METKLVRFDEGEIIFKLGEESRTMYIIRSGTVKIFINKGGKDIFLTELGKGHYIGEMSFLTGIKRTATVIANSRVMANMITPDILNEDNIGISTWVVSVAKVLVKRIHRTTKLLGDYMIHEDKTEKDIGRRADDIDSISFRYSSNTKPERLYLSGKFIKSSIESLKSKIRELKLKNISPLILDFSEVIEIDQAGINYIYNLIQTSDSAEKRIQIENTQLIRNKVLAIQGIHEILITTRVPLKRVNNDELLIKQGDPGNVMYIVKTGSFKISRKTKSGKIKLAIAEPGDVIGEMSLIKEGVRSADVRAQKSGVVHVIDIKEFYNNIYNVPSWFMDLIQALVQRLRDTDEMLDLITINKKNKESVKKWDTPIGVILDSSHPGKYIIKGNLTIANLQYIIQLLKLEMRRKTKKIILDFAKVKYMDKEGIAILLNIYTRFKARGISLEIKGPQKDILYLFKQYDISED